jgi:hypothetical protein
MIPLVEDAGVDEVAPGAGCPVDGSVPPAFVEFASWAGGGVAKELLPLDELLPVVELPVPVELPVSVELSSPRYPSHRV